MVLGILPVLNKEPSSLNSFLQPAIDELKELRNCGMKIRTYDHPTGVIVKGMLLVVTADVPACRKIGGYLAHSANYGCSKCLKVFPGKVGEKDYSGFDQKNWPKRTHSYHVESIKEIEEANSTNKRKKLETEYGCRYSKLMDLPYYDSVEMAVIDPMHCLFLAVAKRFFGLLVDREILTPAKLNKVDLLAKELKCASSQGRIPPKLNSNWKTMNAQEWKAWVLTYSSYCFQFVIPRRYYDVWTGFVLEC